MMCGVLVIVPGGNFAGREYLLLMILAGRMQAGLAGSSVLREFGRFMSFAAEAVMVLRRIQRLRSQ